MSYLGDSKGFYIENERVESMKKTGILILGLLILLLSTIDASAAKSRTTATAYAVLVPLITGVPVIQGAGQLYNGQSLKAGGFFINGMIGAQLLFSEYSSLQYLGIGMVLGGYVWSIYDANVSPKKFDQQRLKSGPSNVNSAPPQILIGSYNLRF